MNYKDQYFYVWLIDDDISTIKLDHDDFIISQIKSKRHLGYSLTSLYYLSRSRYIFCTHGVPCHYKRRKNQFVINFWHGCGYKDGQSLEKALFTYGFVPSDIFIPIKSRQWKCSTDRIVPMGYPRYDIILSNKKIEKIKINNSIINFSTFSKIILWMPTFRQSIKGDYQESAIKTESGLPLLKTNEDLNFIDSILVTHNFLLLVKRHPSQEKYNCEDSSFKNVVFISNNDINENNIDLYVLFNVSNALISDYSSAGVDYLITQKPVAYALDDFEMYKHSRGFVFDDIEKYMPGNKLYNVQDMADFLLSLQFDRDEYFNARKNIESVLIKKSNNYCEDIYQFLHNKIDL